MWRRFSKPFLGDLEEGEFQSVSTISFHCPRFLMKIFREKTAVLWNEQMKPRSKKNACVRTAMGLRRAMPPSSASGLAPRKRTAAGALLTLCFFCVCLTGLSQNEGDYPDTRTELHQKLADQRMVEQRSGKSAGGVTAAELEEQLQQQETLARAEVLFKTTVRSKNENDLWAPDTRTELHQKLADERQTVRRSAQRAGGQEAAELEERLEQEETLSRAEALFENTVRSCLGAHCFAERVSGVSGVSGVGVVVGVPVTRVGVLMPDPAGHEILLQMLHDAGADGSSGLMDMQFASNVPPYGYGKNHGWSRIVRVVRRVLPNAVSLLKVNFNTTDLMEPQVQQLLRWHCRLSHVAAHTAMLTVFSDDLLTRPAAELGKIVTFAGGKVDHAGLLASLVHLPALRREWAEPSISLGAERLSELYQTGLTALRKEMVSSKNMTRWPCKSFYDVPRKDAARLPLPASTLTANCSAVHTKCSVRFEIEEFRRNSPIL